MSEAVVKSKSLSKIEDRMKTIDEGSYRYQVLNVCRRFKTCWIELGQSLYAVHRDKQYQDWGYLTFEGYCGTELGVLNQTAMKLLKSYQFLETEEP